MITRWAPTYGVSTALSSIAIGLEICASIPTVVRKNFGDPPSVRTPPPMAMSGKYPSTPVR